MGLGVAGAALATLLARVVETVILLSVVYLRKYPIACRPMEMVGYSKAFLRQFVTTCTPVIANEFIWGLGITIYSLAYGRMGDNAVAAITIATTKRAERYATNFFVLQFLVTLFGMAVCMLIRGPILSIYRITPEVSADAALCILVFVLFMPAKMFNYVNVVGVLRSGGDTKMCLFLDTSGVWLIGIPLAFLGGLYFRYPIHIE